MLQSRQKGLPGALCPLQSWVSKEIPGGGGPSVYSAGNEREGKQKRIQECSIQRHKSLSTASHFQGGFHQVLQQPGTGTRGQRRAPVSRGRHCHVPASITSCSDLSEAHVASGPTESLPGLLTQDPGARGLRLPAPWGSSM